MAQAEPSTSYGSAFDTAYSSKDRDALAALLAEDVVLRGDGVVLEAEIRGKDAVSKLFSSYMKRYAYKHGPLFSSAPSQDSNGTYYSMWVDHDVKARGQEGSAVEVLGVWKLVAEEAGHIKEIWCLRQPTAEEWEKMESPPVARLSYNAAALSELKAPFSDAQRQQLQETMCKYNRMWKEREPELAAEILAPDFRNVDFLRGYSTVGREAVVEMVKQLPGGWRCETSSLEVSFVAGTSTAFGHWAMAGFQRTEQEEDARMAMWGLDLMAFDPETLLLVEDFSGMYMGPATS